MFDFHGFSAEVFSGVAVAVSGYSLWHTSFRQADLKVFVPPLIRYASPYQNTIFEVFEIPLTVINNGAQTGTILSFDLEVTNPRTGGAKHFYSAGLGPWSLAKARGENLEPFTPISLGGRASQSQTLLFEPRSNSTIRQIVDVAGSYEFALTLLTAKQDGLSLLGKRKPVPMAFEMVLPFIDHRAFTSGSGSLPLNHPEWQATSTEI